jgi:methylated-DNA-protein-cysteine methyltransferase-like protein
MTMLAELRTYIRKIPKGKVAAYGDIARAAGYPGCARQVVWALHSAQGLPWQRVVGAGGKIRLGGEHGFEQRLMLQAEDIVVHGSNVDMKIYGHHFKNKKPVKKKSGKK